MNVLDFILLLLLIGAGISGYRKGFFQEASSFAGLLAGIYLGVIAAQVTGRVLEGMVSWNLLPFKIIAFILAFILINIGFWAIGASLTRIFKALMINFFNKLLGVFFGVLKTSVLISVAVFFLFMFNEKWPFFSSRWFDNSVIFEKIEGLAPWLLEHLF